ncbi:MAG: hypothetical protein WA087_01210 [Candidatus Saccharimonadales bacterium]
MTTESDRTINSTSEKSSDKMSEKMSEFIKSPIGKFAVGMLVVIVVGSGIAAEKYFNRDKVENEATNTPPQQEQQVTIPSANEDVTDPSRNSASAEQVNTPETNETLPTVESIEIKDQTLLDRPEELMTILQQKRTDLINYGRTEENADKSVGLRKEDMSSMTDIIDKVYFKALLPEDYESNTSLKDFAQTMQDIHKDVLYKFSYTFHTGYNKQVFPEDKEPYSRSMLLRSIEKIDQIDNNTTIIIAKTYDEDNSKENRVAEKGVITQDNKALFTFQYDGKSLKLIDYRKL